MRGKVLSNFGANSEALRGLRSLEKSTGKTAFSPEVSWLMAPPGASFSFIPFTFFSCLSLETSLFSLI
jgi:hypothetical protein